MSNITTVFLLVLALIIVPVALLIVTFLPHETLASEEFESKYGALVEGIDTRRKWKVAYMLVFVLRRSTFLLIVLLWIDPIYQTQQVQVLLLVTMFAQMHGASAWALTRRAHNLILLANEVFVFAITIHTLFFTGWLSDSQGYSAHKKRLDLGWSMVILTVTMCSINIFLIVWESVHSLNLACTKYGRLIVFKYCNSGKQEAAEELDEEETEETSPEPS